MSSRDAGSFRQPGGGGNGGGNGSSAAAPPHHNNNNNGVKFAGEESKDKMYEPKHTKKLVRVLTVVAYIFSVSLAAIMLSVYYVFLWQPRDQYALHARVRGGGAAAAATTTENRSAVSPAPTSPPPPTPAPVACECPPSPPAAPETHGDAPPPPPPAQHHHQDHEERRRQQQQPLAVPALAAPASDEISASQHNKEQVSTTQTPEGDIAESIEGHMKSKQQVTDIPQVSREGQSLPFRSFQNALQV